MARKDQDDFDGFDNFDVDAGSGTADIGTLDLTSVSETPQFEVLPAGIYDAIIDSAEFGYSQRSGNPMLTWTMKVATKDGRERTMFYHTVLVDTGLSRLKRLLNRLMPQLDEPIDLANFRPSKDAEHFIGLHCRVRLRTQTYEGTKRNSISDILEPTPEAVAADLNF